MNTKEVKNKAFWKVINLLAHPFTITSIVILFINDYFLRVYWPSWWTGKLGDFAWMFFFPLVAGAFLSMIVPLPTPKREKIVEISAILLTGLIFSLSNTVPFFHKLINQALEFLLRVPINLKNDPTDLLALASLFAVWKFWENGDNSSKLKLVSGWVVIQIGIILTVANMPAQDYGINSLTIEENQIVAGSSYARFVSDDGGLTWEEIDLNHPTSEEQTINETTDIKYTYTPGEIIKISRDGGETYPYSYSLSPVEQPLQIKYEMRSGIPVFKEGPLDASIDPVSGNVIFAMGHEGILVFSSNNTWEWVPMGDYHRLTYHPENEFFVLLIGEILMSLGFGFLVINTLTLSIHQGCFRKVAVSVGWLSLFMVGVFFPPALFPRQPPSYFLTPIIQYIMIVFGVLIFLFLGILDLVKVFDYSREAVRGLFVIGGSSIIVFLTPYLLWGFTIIPGYSTAVVLAYCIGGLMLGSVYLAKLDDLNALSEQIHET